MNSLILTYSPVLTRRFLSALALFLGLALPACLRAVTLLPQEQAIADYMVHDPDQHRPQLILDPIIEEVARARAKDMAQRGYFSHVNPDGHAADYLLQQAGYVLPAYFGTDPTSNYVESIAAGYASPSDTWNAWMGDSGHKDHLLALVPFYATETHYGVGYYYDSSSPYQYYWVVITAPPQPVPNLAITSPASSETVTAPSLQIAGSTSPTSNTATVQYRVENSAGISAYQSASGIASWTATVTGLQPGPNVIRVQSLNSSGAQIAMVTRNLNYLVEGSLTVTISGSGSITSGFAGVTSQPVGQPITLRATPAAGSIFAGWSGSTSTSAAAITFTMQPGFQLQASFIPNPFGPVTGSFYGTVTSGTAGYVGVLRATVSSGGTFTGRLGYLGASYALLGRFDASGNASLTLPRHAGLAPLVLSLQVALSGSSQALGGTVTDGTTTADIAADHATFNSRTHAAPQSGHYTLAFLPATSSSSSVTLPHGFGYASASVSTGGAVTLAGRMGDGTPFTQSGIVTENGSLALCFTPTGSPAGSLVTGLITFQSTPSSDLAGSLDWTKVPRRGDSLYPAGFSTSATITGSRYVAPRSGLRPLLFASAPPSATVSLGSGDLADPLTVPVLVSSGDRGAMLTPGAPGLSFAINPLTGSLSGSFTVPGGKLLRSFRGIVLQKQNAALGLFRGASQSGYFSLTAPAP